MAGEGEGLRWQCRHKGQLTVIPHVKHGPQGQPACLRHGTGEDGRGEGEGGG